MSARFVFDGVRSHHSTNFFVLVHFFFRSFSIQAERDAVRTALNTGVLVTGERAVAIGGDTSDVLTLPGAKLWANPGPNAS